ncbi:hypothetical protein J6590_018197 [Homalodisca vitripennis]|nr:hypothetical protein J6590_018197 [Homalodisca vitripennis]
MWVARYRGEHPEVSQYCDRTISLVTPCSEPLWVKHIKRLNGGESREEISSDDMRLRAITVIMTVAIEIRQCWKIEKNEASRYYKERGCSGDGSPSPWGLMNSENYQNQSTLIGAELHKETTEKK